MNSSIKVRFTELWVKYFGNEEPPITFYYSDKIGDIEEVKASERWSCMIGQLAMVRKGTSLPFNIDSIGCAGGKKIQVMPKISDPILSISFPVVMKGKKAKDS